MHTKKPSLEIVGTLRPLLMTLTVICSAGFSWKSPLCSTAISRARLSLSMTHAATARFPASPLRVAQDRNARERRGHDPLHDRSRNPTIVAQSNGPAVGRADGP